MKKQNSRIAGYTLIEVIMVLALTGILTAVAGMTIVTMTQGFVTARTNADTAQKAELAMSRIVREFQVLSSVSIGTDRSITYEFRDTAGVLVTHTLSWNGGANDPIQLDADTLTDDVNNFQLSYIYYDAMGNEITESSWTANSQGIEVTLALNSAVNYPYTARIFPRNL